MERLIHQAKDTHDKFRDMWAYWIHYRESLNSADPPVSDTSPYRFRPSAWSLNRQYPPLPLIAFLPPFFIFFLLTLSFHTHHLHSLVHRTGFVHCKITWALFITVLASRRWTTKLLLVVPLNPSSLKCILSALGLITFLLRAEPYLHLC